MQSQAIVVSAPSGAGKTSLTRALLQKRNDCVLSVSHTTRAPRPGEIDGIHYHFVDKAVFEQMIADDKFLEHAEVYGNCYGTARDSVERYLDKDISVLLDIEWQGARQVRARISPCIGIYILPPSMADLEQRLRDRGTDSEESIEQRLKSARQELDYIDEYNYVIINDNFERALSQMNAIVEGEGKGDALDKDWRQRFFEV